MSSILLKPTVQIRHKSLILYDQIEYLYSRSQHSLQILRLQLSQVRTETYKAEITEGAKKRLSKAIDLMCQAVKVKRFDSPVTGKRISHRLSYITLTISDNIPITLKEAYNKGLIPFLQWLRRTQKVTTYIWKVERQQRGQLHYHITTPSWIHYQEIRDKWNNIQRQNDWMKEYTEATGSTDPNSTDIHSVRSIKNLSGYMIKEFVKSIQNINAEQEWKTLTEPEQNKYYSKGDTEPQAINRYIRNNYGKLWDCTLNLKKFKYMSIEETTTVNEHISEWIEKNKCTVIPLENCIVIRPITHTTLELLNLKQLQDYDALLTAIRNYRKDT